MSLRPSNQDLVPYMVCFVRPQDHSINLAPIFGDQGSLMLEPLDYYLANQDQDIESSLFDALQAIELGGALESSRSIHCRFTKEGIFVDTIDYLTHGDDTPQTWLMLIPESIYSTVYYAGYGRSVLA